MTYETFKKKIDGIIFNEINFYIPFNVICLLHRFLFFMDLLLVNKLDPLVIVWTTWKTPLNVPLPERDLSKI